VPRGDFYFSLEKMGQGRGGGRKERGKKKNSWEGGGRGGWLFWILDGLIAVPLELEGWKSWGAGRLGND